VHKGQNTGGKYERLVEALHSRGIMINASFVFGLDEDLSHYNTAHVVFEPANMTAKELYEGYLNVYKEVYSFRNILRRCPESRKQRVPYFLFNFFYRKYGKLTEKLCRLITYEKIGRIAERWSYRQRTRRT